MLEGFDPNTIHDVDGARQAIIHLLNLVEALASDNRELRDENQRLRDENNRLKGEQGQSPGRPANSDASFVGARTAQAPSAEEESQSRTY